MKSKKLLGGALLGALALKINNNIKKRQDEQIKLSYVTIETTQGNITLELFDDKAPITVQNFLNYVNEGFYDGLIFHRVIDGFMIQGGGFRKDMTRKETGKRIINESDNGLSNDIGTIAMARTNDPDSATSQFFINHKDNHFLNYSFDKANGKKRDGYCVFGKVIEGMNIVNKIATVITENKGRYANVPVKPIIIKKIYKHPLIKSLKISVRPMNENDIKENYLIKQQV